MLVFENSSSDTRNFNILPYNSYTHIIFLPGGRSNRSTYANVCSTCRKLQKKTVANLCAVESFPEIIDILEKMRIKFISLTPEQQEIFCPSLATFPI